MTGGKGLLVRMFLYENEGKDCCLGAGEVTKLRYMRRNG